MTETHKVSLLDQLGASNSPLGREMDLLEGAIKSGDLEVPIDVLNIWRRREELRCAGDIPHNTDARPTPSFSLNPVNPLGPTSTGISIKSLPPLTLRCSTNSEKLDSSEGGEKREYHNTTYYTIKAYFSSSPIYVDGIGVDTSW